MTMMHKKTLRQATVGLTAAFMLALPMAAHADEKEDLEKLRATVLGLIDTLVKSGVIPRAQVDAMMRDAQRKADERLAAVPPAEVGADGKRIVRVPYIPEAVRTQMREQIKSELLAQQGGAGAASGPTAEAGGRLQFEGDIRLRAESILPSADNSAASVVSTSSPDLTRAPDIWANPNFNTQETQSRSRIRARLGVNVAVSETVSAGISLSTGSTTGPTSTNQTMAAGASNTPGYFNKYGTVIDKAFVRLAPTSSLNMQAGRFRNPFLGTDLVWADDLNFEGFAGSWKAAPGTLMDSFLTVGWFPLSYAVPGAQRNRSLTAIQGGVNWQFGTRENRLRLGAALYAFNGIEGLKETTTDKTTVPDYAVRSEYGAGFRQRGNTLFRVNSNNANDPATNWGLASGFRELNLTAVLDVAQFDPLHIVLTGDLVHNLAFDRGQMRSRSGTQLLDGDGTGYLVRVQVGAPSIRKAGDWNAGLTYRRLGSDAVVDAFTNSDFGLGGTNNRGFILSGSYGIAKNTWVSARWLSADALEPLVPAVVGNSPRTKFSVDTLQFELNTRF
ncbi:MAG: putative porin [Rubrivivax sp.]